MSELARLITGVHAIVVSPAAEEVRRVFAETLGLPAVDAGGGWPVFALPPAELAVHPDESPRHELFLMCDDLDATVAALAERGVALAEPVSTQSWGRLTAIALPGGSRFALYEARHPRPTGR